MPRNPPPARAILERPRRTDAPRVLAVANAKGGAGKTSTAVHLAAGLAREGRRVLLVDLDPQGNATAWLLGEAPPGVRGSADALMGRAPDLLAVPDRPGLFVAASTPALAGIDAMLAAEVAGETLLREALARLRELDVIVLDCPPSLGLTVLSALVAADGVLAPVLPAFLSLAGLAQLEATVDRVRERLGARVRVIGYVIFAADGREGMTDEVRRLLKGEAPDRLLESEIRVSAAAKALPATRSTAWDSGGDRRGADDYAALLREVMPRLEGKKPRGR